MLLVNSGARSIFPPKGINEIQEDTDIYPDMVRFSFLKKFSLILAGLLVFALVAISWGDHSVAVLIISLSALCLGIFFQKNSTLEWLFFGVMNAAYALPYCFRLSAFALTDGANLEIYEPLSLIVGHMAMVAAVQSFFKLRFPFFIGTLLFISAGFFGIYFFSEGQFFLHHELKLGAALYFSMFLFSAIALSILHHREHPIGKIRIGLALTILLILNCALYAQFRLESPEVVHLWLALSLTFIPIVEITIQERRRVQMRHKVNGVIDHILDHYVEDIDDYLSWILNEARTILQGERASLVLKDPYTDDYFVAYVSGKTPIGVIGHHIDRGSISEQLIKYGRPVAVANAKYSPFNVEAYHRSYQTLSFLGAPLNFKGKMLGLLFISDPVAGRSWYSDVELEYLQVFSKRISSEIYKTKKLDYMRRSANELELVVRESNNTMEILAGAFEDHYHKEDDDTPGHVGAVMSFSRGILEAFRDLELNQEIKLGDYEKDIDFLSVHFEQRLIRGASLHDVGKREVPVHILRKPGKLDWPDEVQQMWGHGLATYHILKGKRHPIKFNRALKVMEYQVKKFGQSCTNVVNYLDDEGRAFLKSIPPNFEEISQMEFHAVEAAAHQEWYDGAGYPFALTGTEIPVIGRILGVADAIAVMKMRAIYEESKTWEWVYFELETFSGTQFDPVLVKAAQKHLLERIIAHLPESKRWVELARAKGLKGKAARDFVPKFRQPNTGDKAA